MAGLGFHEALSSGCHGNGAWLVMVSPEHHRTSLQRPPVDRSGSIGPTGPAHGHMGRE